MFRIEKYRITFDKHCHDFSVVNNIDGSLIQGSGRYDTCCHIIHGNMVSPTWNGKALLHPNDPVDKIIGKKIALRNAMIRGHRIDPISKKKIPIYHLEFNHKPTRTKIWKAFWAWTESWKPKKEPCPACEILPQLCKEINEKIKRDPKLDAEQI